MAEDVRDLEPYKRFDAVFKKKAKQRNVRRTPSPNGVFEADKPRLIDAIRNLVSTISLASATEQGGKIRWTNMV